MIDIQIETISLDWQNLYFNIIVVLHLVL